MENLSFEIEKDGKEYHVWCPELPGCHTHGKTVKESIEHLKDAIQLYRNFKQYSERRWT